MSSRLDVVTFGESMVLYAPSERGTLESAPAYHPPLEGPSPIVLSAWRGLDIP
jgi:hypothetical protein